MRQERRIKIASKSDRHLDRCSSEIEKGTDNHIGNQPSCHLCEFVGQRLGKVIKLYNAFVKLLWDLVSFRFTRITMRVAPQFRANPLASISTGFGSSSSRCSLIVGAILSGALFPV